MLLYSVFRGIREGIKKKALKLNSTFEVLFLYTFISFIMVIPQSIGVGNIGFEYMFYVFLKSLCVFSAWICNFSAIKKLPVSFSGVMDTSGMLFSAMLSVLVLGETISGNQGFGMALVILGLILLNIKKSPSPGNGDSMSIKYIILCLMGSLFNATSGTMDKFLMKHLTSNELQFYFMLYLTLFYGLYLVITKTKISLKTLKSNPYILIMSILFVIGDKALFEANSHPSSSVVTMTVIKRSTVFVSILVGKLMFKEKHILYRLLCATIVITGIVISII